MHYINSRLTGLLTYYAQYAGLTSNKKLYSVQQCFALLYNQRRTSLDESNTVTDEEDQNSSQSRRTSVDT